MMRDIFICPHGNMLNNWAEAFPKSLVSISVVTVPVNEPVLFWIHANANAQSWLEKTMAEISQKFQMSKIVVLANSPNQGEALAVISKGAVGYCHAYSSASVLNELKTVVTHGGIWLGRDLLQSIIGATKDLVHSPAEDVHQALTLLTPREKVVALQAAKGLSNKEIARVLDITERTVKAHISSSLERLGVKDRLQLALVLNNNPNESAQSAKTIKPTKSVNSSKKAAIAKKLQPASTTFKKKLELAA
jgi:two-component system, NarL family, nitrate/nitrite response regulator NarL